MSRAQEEEQADRTGERMPSRDCWLARHGVLCAVISIRNTPSPGTLTRC